MLENLDRLMDEAGVDAVLAQGSAFSVPDVYWLTGFRSSDEITVLKNKGEEPVVASSFNALDRVKQESFVTRTHDMTELVIDLIRAGKRMIDNPDIVYDNILSNLFTGDVIGVPIHLPAHILIAIQTLGYKVKVVTHLFKDARATKSSREIKMIKKAADATMGAIGKMLELIKDTDIGPNKVLMHNGAPLTVGVIKMALDHFLLDHHAESAEDVILAIGKKAFDWHYLGVAGDKFKAGVPIIMDVFPRLKNERYIADVTRTFVKGTPSKKVQHMYDSVKAAADACTDTLTAGARIDDVNMACYETLKLHGYDSRRLNPEAVDGMTHGLGHGIGLDVHERPSSYTYDDHYEAGNVMAIEPGVYIKKIGGIRIENDYVVTNRKAKRLTLGLDEDFFSL
ncbi:MAG: Xaa-Pro peptidase family protein [Candidatus Thorarchaeota archaeon]